jgi:hypothetical protein
MLCSHQLRKNPENTQSEKDGTQKGRGWRKPRTHLSLSFSFDGEEDDDDV